MDRERTQRSFEPALIRFADALAESINASAVLLFGSHATGSAAPDSDYDLIIVAGSFREVQPLERARGLRQLFYAVGGDAPLDLICVTPEEFMEAQQAITLISAVLPHAIDLLARPVATR
jgi:predicted nucleotidyltransferase